MIRDKLRYVLTVSCLLLSCAALGQTAVPNTFQAGQAARASDVNENFDTLEIAIDQNAAEILRVQGLSGLSPEAAQIQSGLNLTSGLRWLVADYFYDTASLPANNSQAWADPAAEWNNKYVQSATVDVGNIEIIFRDSAAAGIAGKSVTLRFVLVSAGLVWFDCLGDGSTDAYLAELACVFNDEPYRPIVDVRQHVDTAFNLLSQSGAQQLIQNFYNVHGSWPTDNSLAGLGLPTEYRSNYISQLWVSDDGVISVEYGRDANTIIHGDRLTWIPVDAGSSVYWKCESPDIHNRYLPSECRH